MSSPGQLHFQFSAEPPSALSGQRAPPPPPQRSWPLWAPDAPRSSDSTGLHPFSPSPGRPQAQRSPPGRFSERTSDSLWVLPAIFEGPSPVHADGPSCLVEDVNVPFVTNPFQKQSYSDRRQTLRRFITRPGSSQPGLPPPWLHPPLGWGWHRRASLGGSQELQPRRGPEEPPLLLRGLPVEESRGGRQGRVASGTPSETVSAGRESGYGLLSRGGQIRFLRAADAWGSLALHCSAARAAGRGEGPCAQHRAGTRRTISRSYGTDKAGDLSPLRTTAPQRSAGARDPRIGESCASGPRPGIAAPPFFPHFSISSASSPF